jgi:putative membrane protein
MTDTITHPIRLGPRWLSIVGTVTVPLVVAGVLVWSLWEPQTRLFQVQAAIVNLDEPVTVNGQLLPLGRQLAAGLVGQEDTNYSWLITNTDDADQGLADGSYAAVITIPEDFSLRATSVLTDASQAGRATIQVTTAENSKAADNAITALIASTAVSVFSTELTTTYLETVFVGFDTLADGIASATDGAERLAAGVDAATTSASALSEGLQQLDAQAADLPAGVATATGSAEQLATGVDAATIGASALSEGLRQLDAQAANIPAGITRLIEGATNAQDGAASLSEGLQQLTTGTATLASGTATAASSAGQLADGLDQLAGATPTLVTGVNTLKGGFDQLLAGYDFLNDQQRKTLIAELAAGAEQLNTGVTGLDTSTATLATGARALAGSTTNGTGLAALAAGAAQVDSGAQSAATGSATLTAGVIALADGLATLDTGTAALTGAISSASDGAAKLSDGVRALTDGAHALSGGLGTLDTGAVTLTGAISSASDGATQLSDGVRALTDGAHALSDGLTDAGGQIPSYDETERTHLAEVASTPIDTAATIDAATVGDAAAALAAALALWLGSLASFIVRRPLPPDTLGSRRNVIVQTLRGYASTGLIGAVQGLLVAIGLQFALELGVGRWLTLTGASILVGAVFAAVHQALVAWLGGVGRYVGVVVAVVGVAGGVLTAVPGIVTSLIAVTPLQPGTDLIAAAITGTTAPGGIATLTLWGLLALSATALSAARDRTVTVRHLSPATA